MPDVPFITGTRRFIVDVAIYDKLNCADVTLSSPPLSADEISNLFLPEENWCILFEYDQYKSLFADVGEQGIRKWANHIYVLFQPGHVNMAEQIRLSGQLSSMFQMKGFYFKEKSIPGVIGIDEVKEQPNVCFFCLADDYLMDSYSESLSKICKIKELNDSEILYYKQCAIEACYGIGSALKRMEEMQGNA